MDRDRGEDRHTTNHSGEDPHRRRRCDSDGHHHRHKARDSVGRRDSAGCEPLPPPSRKRKDHDSGEPGREGGKRPRDSVDPPPPKEERPRRERKQLESGANGDPQRAAPPNDGARQLLNSAPAVAVPSADPVPSKVYAQFCIC
ncbi:hypothetical protein VPH35_134842 [Triticum aestivum]